MSSHHQPSGAGGVPQWTLTDRLRKAREDRGLTQQQLVDASNGELKLRTVSNYENPAYQGERKRATLRSWAFATGVPLDWLVFGTEPTSDPSGGLVIRPRAWKGERRSKPRTVHLAHKAA